MLAADELASGRHRSDCGRPGFWPATITCSIARPGWTDTIEHTGKAFLGLTINCAKCHDHKYDPISQVDYYRLRAIFEPYQVRLDPVPGETDFEQDGMPRVFDDHLDAVTQLHVRGDPKNPDTETVIEPRRAGIVRELSTADRAGLAAGERVCTGRAGLCAARSAGGGPQAITQAETELAAAQKTLADTPPETPVDSGGGFRVSR